MGQIQKNGAIALEMAVWVFRFNGGGEIARSLSAAGRFDPEADERAGLVVGIIDLVVVGKDCFGSDLRGFELDKRRVKKEVTPGWRQVAIRTRYILFRCLECAAEWIGSATGKDASRYESTW